MRKDSCWTCRIRHKKCDAATPVCGGCAVLEIDCLYHADKPDWMDNGDLQRQMTLRVKAQVKHAAKRRRGIARMESIAKDISDEPDDTRPLSNWNDDNALPLQPKTSPLATAASHQSEGAAESGQISDTPESSHLPIDPSLQPAASCQAQGSNPVTSRTEDDMGYIAGYMEYVFPCLFPFYKPSILDAGRSWVLVLATKNNAFFSSIASLSSYFFSTVPVRPGPGHEGCAKSSRKGLHTQVTSALSTVQSDLIALARQGVGSSLVDSTCLLANIVQYLNFEVAIQSGNWKIHLEAAVDLFEQIMQVHGRPSGTKKIDAILDGLRRGGTGPKAKIPNADQAAFKFFSTALIINDIIASTSLTKPPMLKAYHSELEGGGHHSSVRTEDILGCQPWVLLALSDICTLAAWKKDQNKEDESVVEEMAFRVATIDNRIQAGILELDNQVKLQKQAAPRTFETFLEHPNCTCDIRSTFETALIYITRIWAYTAHTYLLLVSQGWDLSHPEIRRNTTECLKLFRQIDSPSWLRCLVWPFCINGCVALHEERPELYAIRDSMRALQTFGSVNEAIDIMETVWSRDTRSWDIGLCLRSLSYPVLLI